VLDTYTHDLKCSTLCMGANKYAANEAYDEYKQRRENNCFLYKYNRNRLQQKRKNTKTGGLGQLKIETMNERGKIIVDAVLHGWTE
jgi:hypothetical protein